MPTENHDYNQPSRGQDEWDVPLNENTTKLDTDVEIRDTAANRDQYTPKDSALYRATDTGALYLGDGNRWNKMDISVENAKMTGTMDLAGQGRVSGAKELSARGLPRHDVTAYGAVGDGNADDFAAVQRAADAINGDAGVLNFPAGNEYYVSDTVEVYGNGTFQPDKEVYVDLRGAKLIGDWDASNPTLELSAGKTVVVGGWVYGGGVVINSDRGEHWHSRFEGVAMEAHHTAFPGDAVFHIHETTDPIVQTHVSNCDVFASDFTRRFDGIVADAGDTIISDTNVYRTDVGIDFNQAGTQINGGHIWGCHTGLKSSTWGSTTVTGAYIEDNDWAGAELNPSDPVHFCNCQFAWNGCGQYHSDGAPGVDIGVYGGSALVSIESCHFSGNDDGREGTDPKYAVEALDTGTHTTLKLGSIETANYQRDPPYRSGTNAKLSSTAVEQWNH